MSRGRLSFRVNTQQVFLHFLRDCHRFGFLGSKYQDEIRHKRDSSEEIPVKKRRGSSRNSEETFQIPTKEDIEDGRIG